MFVTNDAQTFVSDLALHVIFYGPAVAALLTLLLCDQLPFFSSQERHSVFLTPTANDAGLYTWWRTLSTAYYTVLFFLLALLVTGFSDDPLALGRTITWFIMISMVVSMSRSSFPEFIVGNRRPRFNASTGTSTAPAYLPARRRNTLSPWYSQSETVADNLSQHQKWSCWQEDVISLRRAVDHLEADVPPHHRRNIVLVEIHDNDVASWSAEDSRRLLGCKWCFVLCLSRVCLRVCLRVCHVLFVYVFVYVFLRVLTLFLVP